MPQAPAIEALEERLRRLGAAAEAAQAAWEDAREARDAAIEQADLEGIKPQRIAELVGLSRSAVRNVIRDRTAARQERIRRAAGL
jgi:DNA-directed RNA polymerase specialized sigma24 family protein